MSLTEEELDAILQFDPFPEKFNREEEFSALLSQTELLPDAKKELLKSIRKWTRAQFRDVRNRLEELTVKDHEPTELQLLSKNIMKATESHMNPAPHHHHILMLYLHFATMEKILMSYKEPKRTREEPKRTRLERKRRRETKW